MHDARRGPACVELRGHETHVGINMTEEKLVARAEIVKTDFTFGGLHESVPGTLTVTGKQNIARATTFRQAAALMSAELLLGGRANQGRHRLLENVAQPVFRPHEVVARVEIAVVFDGQRRSARVAEDAKALFKPEPALQCDIEGLNEVIPDIVADPFVEDAAKESAEL